MTLKLSIDYQDTDIQSRYVLLVRIKNLYVNTKIFIKLTKWNKCDRIQAPTSSRMYTRRCGRMYHLLCAPRVFELVHFEEWLISKTAEQIIAFL